MPVIFCCSDNEASVIFQPLCVQCFLLRLKPRLLADCKSSYCFAVTAFLISYFWEAMRKNYKTHCRKWFRFWRVIRHDSQLEENKRYEMYAWREVESWCVAEVYKFYKILNFKTQRVLYLWMARRKPRKPLQKRRKICWCQVCEVVCENNKAFCNKFR